MLRRIHSSSIHVTEAFGSVGRYHFSYGDYHDPSNNRFGVLEALNDFTVEPGSGFKTHPHQEIEIISYCVTGALSHRDSIGNEATLQRGWVGYQCAGSGIHHAELNCSPSEDLRFVQILITPARPGLPPAYKYKNYTQMARRNKWLHVVSRNAVRDNIPISQDANIFVSELDQGHPLVFKLEQTRQGYLLCLEGKLILNDLEIDQGGVAICRGRLDLHLMALEGSHLLLIEMADANLSVL